MALLLPALLSLSPKIPEVMSPSLRTSCQRARTHPATNPFVIPSIPSARSLWPPYIGEFRELVHRKLV